MSTPTGETGSGTQTAKLKKARQAGGFAVVEYGVDGSGGDCMYTRSSRLAGQKEARTELLAMIESGEIKVVGKKGFGIIQVQVDDIVPKSETTPKVTL